uniref:Uncharacterized protein n=1 Tax=Anguilla anguilla TaxID=7936 RepID=A0A0E9SPD9_ANGAN
MSPNTLHPKHSSLGKKWKEGKTVT